MKEDVCLATKLTMGDLAPGSSPQDMPSGHQGLGWASSRQEMLGRQRVGPHGQRGGVCSLCETPRARQRPGRFSTLKCRGYAGGAAECFSRAAGPAFTTAATWLSRSLPLATSDTLGHCPTLSLSSPLSRWRTRPRHAGVSTLHALASLPQLRWLLPL